MELFCVVTLQYQMSVRISIAFIQNINKNCAIALAGHRAAILFNRKLNGATNHSERKEEDEKWIALFRVSIAFNRVQQ